MYSISQDQYITVLIITFTLQLQYLVTEIHFFFFQTESITGMPLTKDLISVTFFKNAFNDTLEYDFQGCSFTLCSQVTCFCLGPSVPVFLALVWSLPICLICKYELLCVKLTKLKLTCISIPVMDTDYWTAHTKYYSEHPTLATVLTYICSINTHSRVKTSMSASAAVIWPVLFFLH